MQNASFIYGKWCINVWMLLAVKMETTEFTIEQWANKLSSDTIEWLRILVTNEWFGFLVEMFIPILRFNQRPAFQSTVQVKVHFSIASNWKKIYIYHKMSEKYSNVNVEKVKRGNLLRGTKTSSRQIQFNSVY